MKSSAVRRCVIRAAALLAAALAMAPRAAVGEMPFYVDTGVKGWNGDGSAASPWSDLSSGAWTDITKGLESGPVTVYFNSRQQRMARGVDMTQTDPKAFGKNRLTFDGNSFYRSESGQREWMPETDSARKAPVESFNSQNKAHAKYSSVTIRGFRITAGNGHKAVSIGGDDWILELCDCSHVPGVTSGPCVLIIPTSDRKHEGSNLYVEPCTNIVIRRNEVHDSCGEAIYVGGGGSQPLEPGSGYPSHDEILIESNVIHDAGSRGRQGDGIDVKGGISHITIRANDIFHLASSEGLCDVRGVVMQGQAPGLKQSYVVERNCIHDSTGIADGAIAIVDSWGVPQQASIRNNLIYNISGKPERPPGGIKVYSATDTISICNNTIAHCAGFGIYLVTGSHYVLRNNLVFANHGHLAEIAAKGVSVESDYNAFEPPWGYAREGAHSLSLSEADIAAALVNPSAGDFRPKPGSAVTGKGEKLDMFDNDILDHGRGQAWDIGALNSARQ